MAFQLPALGYSYNALEAFIDAKTMEIHHTKHHQTYVDNLNAAVQGTDMENLSIEELCKNHASVSAVRNNGGGHYNHSLFWKILTPGGSTSPSGELAQAIEKLGGLDKFKEEFTNAAKTRFGSGWAWLCKLSDGSLKICSTANQDNPLMPDAGCEGTPILGLDVWEHAYYLTYQNRRPDYITAFYSAINWDEVAKNYAAV